MMPLRRVLPNLVAVLVVSGGLVWLVGVTGAPVAAQDSSSTQDSSGDLEARGADLFGVRCSSCHGDDGRGIDGRGPDLSEEGEAAADFVLRTGRMPLADPAYEPQRGPVRFSEDEITALVAYVGSLGDGPEIPDVDPSRGDAANGGDLFRLNCAACHVASGAGAIIGSGRRAPTLSTSTPTEIGEAIVVGPNAMPIFGEFTDSDIDDVASYIGDLQEQGTTDVDSLGGIGPVAEGLVTWLVPLALLIALTRWIGSPNRTSEPSQPDTGVNE